MSPLVERSDHHVAKAKGEAVSSRSSSSCSCSLCCCCHGGGSRKATAVAVAIDEEKFSPVGLHVLVVDDDIIFLSLLEKKLRQCDYKVTACTRASQAISLVMENKDGFDIVMSDVYLPGQDGFKLLEVVGIGLGLPVIMMSENGETDIVMRSITGGACDFLIKPIRTEELRTIWQHVVRRHRHQNHPWNPKDNHGDLSDRCIVMAGESNKRKHGGCEVIKDVNCLKTARVHWTPQLHQRFVKAVNQTGLDNAAPKRILEMMNVQGLTRENVASHLQKYRLYLKRLSGSFPEPRPVASFQAARDGKSGGTMQIRQRGKTIPLSSSLSSSSSAIKASPLRLELAGDLDHATLRSLEQFQAYEKKLVANEVQVLQGFATDAAPPTYRSTNSHVDQGYESGPELHKMTHVGWLRKNLQGGGGHRASSPLHDSATQSFKLDFAELNETKPLPNLFGLSTHQSQFQNPSTTTKTLEENDIHKVKAKRLIDEGQNIDEEELLFKNFVQEEFPDHVKVPPDQRPTLIAAAGDLSKKHFMLGDAFLPYPVHKEETTKQFHMF